MDALLNLIGVVIFSAILTIGVVLAAIIATNKINKITEDADDETKSRREQ